MSNSDEAAAPGPGGRVEWGTAKSEWGLGSSHARGRSRGTWHDDRWASWPEYAGKESEDSTLQARDGDSPASARTETSVPRPAAAGSVVGVARSEPKTPAIRQTSQNTRRSTGPPAPPPGYRNWAAWFDQLANVGRATVRTCPICQRKFLVERLPEHLGAAHDVRRSAPLGPEAGCGIPLGNMAQQEAQNRTADRIIPSRPGPARTMPVEIGPLLEPCPACAAQVKPAKLPKHYAKVHPGLEVPARAVPTPAQRPSGPDQRSTQQVKKQAVRGGQPRWQPWLPPEGRRIVIHKCPRCGTNQDAAQMDAHLATCVGHVKRLTRRQMKEQGRVD